MPSVANTVIVHNRTERAYRIGDVEVPAKGWGRVDPDDPFLATLVARGSFKTYPDAPVDAPVVPEPEPIPVPEPVVAEEPAVEKKSTAKKTNPKGDES